MKRLCVCVLALLLAVSVGLAAGTPGKGQTAGASKSLESAAGGGDQACPAPAALAGALKNIFSSCGAALNSLVGKPKEDLLHIAEFFAGGLSLFLEGPDKLHPRSEDVVSVLNKVISPKGVDDLTVAFNKVSDDGLQIASNGKKTGSSTAFLEASASTEAGCSNEIMAVASGSCAQTYPIIGPLLTSFAKGLISKSILEPGALADLCAKIKAIVDEINKKKNKKLKFSSNKDGPNVKVTLALLQFKERFKLASTSRAVEKSPNFPTIGANGAAWATRMGCSSGATEMADLGSNVNGCSVPGGWYLYIGTFTDACEIHDICYGCPSKGTRRMCDSDFFDNMTNLCTDKYCQYWLDSIPRGFCYDVVWDYWIAVRAGGGDHFSTSDRPFCARPCYAKMAKYKLKWDGKWC